MKKYLIYSTLLAVILFIGSLLAIVVYDLIKIPYIMNQVVHKIEDVIDLQWESDFESNLTYEDQLEGNYIHESRYSYHKAELSIEANLVHSDITVEPTDGAEIEIFIKTKYPERYRIEFEGDKLVINEKKQKRLGLFSFKNGQKSEVIVKIPTTFVQLELETINGDVFVKSVGMGLVVASTVN